MKDRHAHLGPPAIAVAGLQMWFARRPRGSDRWLSPTVHCGEGGASVWVDGEILTLGDLETWHDRVEDLFQGQADAALLEPPEPNLRVLLRRSDRLGHLLLRVDLTPSYPTQEHRFDFEIDPSYLPRLLSQLRAVIERADGEPRT